MDTKAIIEIAAAVLVAVFLFGLYSWLVVTLYPDDEAR